MSEEKDSREGPPGRPWVLIAGTAEGFDKGTEYVTYFKTERDARLVAKHTVRDDWYCWIAELTRA